MTQSIHGNIDLRYGAEDGTFSEHIKSDITRNYSAKVKEFLKETYEQHITESSKILFVLVHKYLIWIDHWCMTIDGSTVKINQPSGTQNATAKVMTKLILVMTHQALLVLMVLMLFLLLVVLELLRLVTDQVMLQNQQKLRKQI